jgi:hypothetical protein
MISSRTTRAWSAMMTLPRAMLTFVAPPSWQVQISGLHRSSGGTATEDPLVVSLDGPRPARRMNLTFTTPRDSEPPRSTDA